MFGIVVLLWLAKITPGYIQHVYSTATYVPMYLSILGPYKYYFSFSRGHIPGKRICAVTVL